jgi:hypothetical protein
MNDVETMMLYCPAGQSELDAIKRTGFRTFPGSENGCAFNFLLNEEFATFIAREIYANDPLRGHMGYVLSLLVRTSF